MKTHKKCSKCKNTKSIDSFYKNKARSDGFCNYCKKCDIKDRRKKETKVKYRKNYREKNLEKIQAYHKQYYQENKQLFYERNKQWCEDNRDRYRELWANYYKTEKGRKQHAFQQAKRRAQKLNATIPGFDRELKEIYKNCPKGQHVDHVVPLLNDKVCGLHVPWNLQYLTAEENFKKNNNFEDVCG